MRTPFLLLAVAAMALASLTASADSGTTPAIDFVRVVYQRAATRTTNLHPDGETVTARMSSWSATSSHRKIKVLNRVVDDLSAELDGFCTRNGGSVGRQRCWRSMGAEQAIWFSYTWEFPLIEHRDSVPSVRFVVYELDPSRLGEPGADEEWTRVGLNSAGELRAKREQVVAAIAAERAAKAEAEQARIATEQARLVAEAPRKKIKGTQVCKRQDNGTFLGYIEESSGDRIKVLVTEHFWGEPGVKHDTNYRGQEYVWSDLSEWRLC